MGETMNDIKVLASSLSAGDSLRTVCPSCQGGGSGEASFVIRKDDEGVVYCCFRANCGYKGGYRGKPSNLIRTKQEVPADYGQKEKNYKEQFTVAPFIEAEPALEEEFRKRYHFDPVLLNTRVTKRSYLFPCYDSRGFKTGHVEKFCVDKVFSLERHMPKVLTRKHSPDVVLLNFCSTIYCTSGPLIIVEDVISAGAVASEGLHAVALLGTDTTEDGWHEVSQYAHRWCNGEAVVALDYDATNKAIDLSRKKKQLFNSLGVLMLNKDIKDMGSEERTKLLSQFR